MAEGSDPVAFALTDEQRDFRSAVRAFLEHYSPEPEVRRAMQSHDGYDTAVWRAMAEQLNLQGLVIPEAYGGEGFGYTEMALVLEEMGAALLPGPYFASSVLAASVLVLCADEDAKTRYLPGIANGDTIATVALTERNGRWNLDGIETRAEHVDGGWTLHGTKHYVPDGILADLILVVARTGTSVGVFCVDDVAALDRRPQSTLDPTRRQAVIDMVGAPATQLGADSATLALALSHASAALASEQVGGAQRCLDQAVGYAKVRHQFGRPIGSFQAIRHACADLMLAVECARGAAQYAAHAADRLLDALPGAAALAKAHCTEVYARAAAANIQLHGGIGFTWEHPAHLYFKRAQSSAMLLGDADHHRRLLADCAGL
ncbi:acyl-CoA dehydrogenase family protein [Mycobacterium stomatepiae]|uniref:Acyl-CoA dehydrogenase n=1 Tax=Mycobacterium stomatepiae TaxID=470076 RepID=A0A7I7Q6W6_9MYCO|nr:acyl-CoA dehydrogenase family protein [Mycobacterium stomatepiae]MCV7168111.1 acyl-CoA/acyl-ACP dehydrogenase [Mycobacterium stomatepiae]BBY21993.1 acyl-CoA dehydrogenase [Mycobacterium stomatepiae]